MPTATTQALVALARGSAAFWPKPKPAFPPITGADDSNGFAAIGKTNHQNSARCATDAKQSRFLSTVSFIGRDQMLWIWGNVNIILPYSFVECSHPSLVTLPASSTQRPTREEFRNSPLARRSLATTPCPSTAAPFCPVVGGQWSRCLFICPITGLGADVAWVAASVTE